MILEILVILTNHIAISWS